MSNTTGPVLLRCGHTQMFDPQPKSGDTVYCRRCGKYSVVKVAEQEWSWTCPGCHSGRKFGAVESAARRSARTHQRKHHHVVLLKLGYEVKEIVGPEGQEELSFGGEKVTWVAQHQGPLKALVEKRIVQSRLSKVDG